MADLLQTLAAYLVIPGLPAWTGLFLLLVLGLAVLAFLAMPFSVFGVKSRLEAIETQLADLQAEIRALRLPEPPRRAPPMDEGWAEPPPPAPRDASPRLTPPVPPPPAWADPPPRSRAEPRLDWPRERH